MKTRNCIMKYYGSKRRMVHIIRSCMPSYYERIVEGFFGSGAVTINIDKPDGCEVIGNEKEPNLYNFWKVLSDKEQGLELIERLNMIDVSREVFEKAHWNVKYIHKDFTEVDRAINAYLEIALSYNGARKNFSSQALQLDLKKKVAGDFSRVYEKFQKENVQILNRDMLDVLMDLANEPEEMQRNTVLYLDPPYLPDLRAKGASKVYICEMPYEVHIKMLQILQRIKCKVILCGYSGECFDVYSEMLLPFGYSCYLGAELPKSPSNQKNKIGKEYLWCNYKLPEGALVKPHNYKPLLVWDI